MKLSKKFIAIMLTFVFALSLVPFSASAETETLTLTLTGTDKLAGEMYGGDSTNRTTIGSGLTAGSSKDFRFKNDTNASALKTFIQYNVSKLIPYLSGSDTEITFSIVHGGNSSSRKTYAYDLYILKGDYVSVDGSGAATSLLSMQYAMDKGLVEQRTVSGRTYYDLVDESTGLLKKVDSYTSNGNRGAYSHTILGSDIKEYLGKTGWITFVFSSPSADTNLSYIRPLLEKTNLYASYNTDQAQTDDAILGEIRESFTWNDVSSEPQNLVTSATKLPNGFRMADIAWTANVDGVIGDDGYSIVGLEGEITSATLTATFTYKDATPLTKEFPVTVCDGKVSLGEPELTIEGTTATASISVTNGTAEDVAYNLYLVVYTNDEMTELVPGTLNVTSCTETNEELTCSVPSGSKVKFLVWKADGITPATVYAEN